MTDTDTEFRVIPERAVLVSSLKERDGLSCMHPDCGKPLDFTIIEGSGEVTIDHWIPQWFGKSNNWKPEEIWALSNLRLMHKRCNAKKGEAIPNEDGTLPAKPQSSFRYRRDKRATRPELCVQCDNGHNLLIGEYCASCGCNAQRFPRWAKVSANECEHNITWCWACSIGIVERESSIATAMRQADSTELGEFPVED